MTSLYFSCHIGFFDLLEHFKMENLPNLVLLL